MLPIAKFYLVFSCNLKKNKLDFVKLRLNSQPFLIKHLLLGLIFFCVLTLNNAYGLATQTAEEINGNAPYITFDEGITKIYTFDELFNIKLSDKSEIKSTKDTSSKNAPLVLPSSSNNTFSSIKTFIPLFTEGNSDYPKISLDNLINGENHYWGDDDGDGANGITVTGVLEVKWEKSDGTDITKMVKDNPSAILEECNAPYKLTLIGKEGSLSTKYGFPNKADFSKGSSSHSYFIRPSGDPKVCYAQPNLALDSENVDWRDSWNHGSGEFEDLDGPDWVTNKGFVPQDITTPIKNFPTTGSNNLRFYLLLGGISPREVLKANGETVSSEIGGNVKLLLSAKKTPGWGTGWNGKELIQEDALEIILQGPSVLSNDKSFMPMTFKLYSDKEKTKLLYSFRLERWFIAQGPTVQASKASTQEFCDKINYRLPDINDFTNANRFEHGWYDGIPNRDINNYRRQLSYKNGNNRWVGGLFNEWGRVWSAEDSYPNSDWPLKHRLDWFWTTYYNLTIDAGEGAIDPSSDPIYRAACVYP